VVLAETPARAEQLLALAEQGRERFERSFNQPAARFAIVEIAEDALSQQKRSALKTMGFEVVLPWLSSNAHKQQVEQSVRQAVEAQLAGKSLGEDIHRSTIEAALAQARSQMTDEAAKQRDATAIPHELGHMWFINSYWPSGNAGLAAHYGGPGPDWLDEMAAVIVEPDASKDRRRALFWDRYGKIASAAVAKEAATDPLLNLTEYFETAHPASEAAQRLAGETGKLKEGATVVRVLTGDAAQQFGGDGIRFYLQSLLLSDYLVEATGNPSIFNDIAQRIAKGETLDGWLKRYGRKNGLATNVTQLETDWETWLGRKWRTQNTAPKSVN
jgi:hypothetical protein